MSWPQWQGTVQSGVPGLPVVNPTQSLLNATNPSIPMGVQYTPEQWQQVQHQNWQQWAQWQQQYQQWHQQYGAEYQKTMNAFATTSTGLPNTSAPPPLPQEPKPPLPPEEPPIIRPNYPNMPAATAAAAASPPNFKAQQANNFQAPNTIGKGTTWRGQPNMSKPPPIATNLNKPPPNFQPANYPLNMENTTKRPSTNPSEVNHDAKRSKFEQNWQSQPSAATPAPQTSANATATNQQEELSESEKKFMKQFAEWEAQFNKWKEQNQDHPDKAQYKEYEKKWEAWRNQLLERREQMRRRRLGLPSTDAKQVISKVTPQSTKQIDDAVKGLFATNAKDPFLSFNQSGGIPGLDLVDSDKKLLEKADADDGEKSSEAKKPIDIPNLEALSKNINLILGDQKLLNMLSLVTQNKNLNLSNQPDVNKDQQQPLQQPTQQQNVQQPVQQPQQQQDPEVASHNSYSQEDLRESNLHENNWHNNSDHFNDNAINPNDETFTRRFDHETEQSNKTNEYRNESLRNFSDFTPPKPQQQHQQQAPFMPDNRFNNNQQLDDRFMNDDQQNNCDDNWTCYSNDEQQQSQIDDNYPDEILNIEKIIDYDHKSKKTNVLEVSVEPVRLFDYRHKPVNRIPLPERPKWLLEKFKHYPEFEPSIARPPQLHGFRRFPSMDYRAGPSYPRDEYMQYNNKRSYPDEFSDERRHYDDRRRFEQCNSEIEDNRKTFEQPITNTDEKMKLYIVRCTIDDLLNVPGRNKRPSRIVIILRGPPGSGKTFLAKLIKDKEIEFGNSAPRILSLDDYFMVEQEKDIVEDGKRMKVKEMVYEYEECMESSYRTSLLKSFKKTITDGFFSFIIVDNVNDKVKHFSEMWSFAKQNGFQVYVCQLELDVPLCTKRNVHGRTANQIENVVSGWETTPTHYIHLDATNLIQAGSIAEVEMEEINSPNDDFDDDLDDVIEIDREEEACISSKWDKFECSIDNLAKLDGTSKPLRGTAETMEDYLQLDEWDTSSKPGQKRVRWADLEERKQQEKMRAIGFVVGQTDWDRMMDPTQGGSALTKTKYIERARNNY